MMDPRNLQNKLIAQILQRFPRKADAAEALGKLLNLGKDAIYRRLRGDSLLSHQELAIVARKFNISIDAIIFEKSDTVFFNYNNISNGLTNFRDFLLELKNNLVFANNLPETHFFYASAEIPVFLYCYFPELISFKLYSWGRTTWDLEYLNDQKFYFDLIPYSTLEITKEIVQLYQQLPSTELWHLNIIDNTLNQIVYSANSGAFRNPEDALLLCDKVMELTEHMRQMAKAGKKMMPGTGKNEPTGAAFNLYHNEMVYTNNTILVESPVGKMVFSTFDNPNFIKCTDQRMCEYIDHWFQGIIQKSVSISHQAEKNRAWFFNAMQEKVGKRREQLEHLF